MAIKHGDTKIGRADRKSRFVVQILGMTTWNSMKGRRTGTARIVDDVESTDTHGITGVQFMFDSCSIHVRFMFDSCSIHANAVQWLCSCLNQIRYGLRIPQGHWIRRHRNRTAWVIGYDDMDIGYSGHIGYDGTEARYGPGWSLPSRGASLYAKEVMAPNSTWVMKTIHEQS